MKFIHFALLAVLGAALATPAFAQTGGGQGMGPGAGMGAGRGPGAGMGPGKGMRFTFNNDNTPGWTMMSPEERTAHQRSMLGAKSYAECKAAQAAQHETMMARARQKGVTLPTPRANGCDRMKAQGFFK